MSVCSICGNNVPASSPACPFCQNKLRVTSVKQPRKSLYILNIKRNMPTCEEAEKNLRNNLLRLGNNGYSCVKVIHGYGSSGIGGELRHCLRDALRRLRNTGIVDFFVEGENFHFDSDKSKKLLQRMPSLRKDKDFNKTNRGVTIVKL